VIPFRNEELMKQDQNPTCPTCRLFISTEDTVTLVDGQLSHFDCQRPRILTPEERLLLATYCWDHAVADCVGCARGYRVPELVSVPVDGGTHFCPFCGRDMIERLRVHLYTCTMLPAHVRRRAKAARETAQRLVKHAHQLSEVGDVLMRRPEAAGQSLRDAMRQSPTRST
jgi:hypothetical protein